MQRLLTGCRFALGRTGLRRFGGRWCLCRRLRFGHSWGLDFRFGHRYRCYHRGWFRSFLFWFSLLLAGSFRFLLRTFLRFSFNRQTIAPPLCRSRTGNKASMKFRGQSTVLIDRRTKIGFHANRNVDLRFDPVAEYESYKSF